MNYWEILIITLTPIPLFVLGCLVVLGMVLLELSRHVRQRKHAVVLLGLSTAITALSVSVVLVPVSCLFLLEDLCK